MTVLTKYPSQDGAVRYYSGAGTWASIRAEATGTNVYPSTDPSPMVYSDASLPLIIRGFLYFDTTDVPAGTNITEGRVRIYGSSIVGTVGSVCLVNGTQADTLSTADYDQAGTTELSDTRIAITSWNTSGYNDFPLNAAGIAAINEGGTTKLALRHSSDLDNSSPASPVAAYMYPVEQSGTSKDPILELTIPTPAARNALGSEVTIFQNNGSAGTFGAHYAFSTATRCDDGLLLCVARKASSHASYDGILVGKRSLDPNGLTWGSEFTIRDDSGSGYDWRDGKVITLASGRIAMVGPRRKLESWGVTADTLFMYSDDDGATWSSPVVLSDAATGLYSGGDGVNPGIVYGEELVELANGDILMFGYGSHSTAGVTPTDLFCSKSTDDGATWTFVSYPALESTYGANVVEPQADIMSNGDIYLTFHTEDGLPTDYYKTVSTDDGATWGSTLLLKNELTFNRQGVTVMSDDSVIVSFNNWSDTSVRYAHSYDGSYFASDVTVAADPVGGSGLDHPLWIMVVSLSGTGDAQNIGFTYNSENTAQNLASVFWRQFGGWYLDASPASTTDTAQPLAATAKRVTIAPAATTDTPVALAVTQANAVTITSSSCTDAAQALTFFKRATVIPATTTDAAQPLTIAASDVLILHPQGMVPGTTIGAYRRWEWKGPVAAKLNAGPGAVVQETTVASDLTASFTLAPGEYVAYASAYPTKRLFFMVTE